MLVDDEFVEGRVVEDEFVGRRVVEDVVGSEVEVVLAVEAELPRLVVTEGGVVVEVEVVVVDDLRCTTVVDELVVVGISDDNVVLGTT